MLDRLSTPAIEQRIVLSRATEEQITDESIHIINQLYSQGTPGDLFSVDERGRFSAVLSSRSRPTRADIEDIVVQIVRARYESSASLPRTRLDLVISRAIVENDERNLLLYPRQEVWVSEVSSLYRPNNAPGKRSPVSTLRRKVADTAMACLMFVQSIIPEGATLKRSDVMPAVTPPPAVIQIIETTASFSVTHTAAFQTSSDVGTERSSGIQKVAPVTKKKLLKSMAKTPKHLKPVAKWADFCKKNQNSVGWDCVAEKTVQTVNSVTAPRGNYSHKYATMADGKGNTPSTGVDALFSGGENCRFELGVQKCDTPSALKQLMEADAGNYDAALRRYQAESRVVADNASDATLRKFPDAPKPVSTLSPMGKRLQSGMNRFAQMAQAAGEAQQKAKDSSGGLPGTTANNPASSVFPTTIAPETIDLGDGIRAHVGGEYNTRLGAIARGDIMAMIGPNLGVSVGGAIGAKHREALIKAGWQIDENNMIKLTYQDLRQFLDYSFRSGNEATWMAQRTLGLTWRFNPNHEWIKYMEVNGFISKSDSKSLGSKTFTIDTPTLFELWENHRRIAGVTSYGASVAANFEVTRDDTIKVTVGAERKSVDLDPTFERPSGVKPLQMRATGSIEYRHDWREYQEGLSTGVTVGRDSMGYHAGGDVRYQVDGNTSVEWYVRHDFRSDSIGLAGGGDDTTFGLRGKVTWGGTDPAKKPAHETRPDADPAGIDKFTSRAAGWAQESGQRSANEKVPPKIGALLDFLWERAVFERTQVEGYAQGRDVRKINVDKTGLSNATVDNQGNITETAAFALGAILTAVNTSNGGASVPFSLFTINGNSITVNTAGLEPYIRSSAVSVATQDTFTITTQNATITIKAFKGSVHITDIKETQNGSVSDVTPPVTLSSPSVSSTTSSGTTLSAKISEAGTGYYLVQAAAAAAPSAATVKASGTSFAMAANTATNTNITGLSASTAYKVYFVAQDSRGNLQASVESASFTTEALANVAPTASNFTFTNGGVAFNTAKTFNWKTGSGAADANGDTLTASVQANGTKGTFSVSGDNVTYTPNAGQSGSDTATIRISDGNGGTKDVVVTVDNINTLAPTLSSQSVDALNGGSGFSSTFNFNKNIGSVSNAKFVDADTGAAVSGALTTSISGSTVTISGTVPGGLSNDVKIQFEATGGGLSASGTFQSDRQQVFG